jgi:hypothetical protein
MKCFRLKKDAEAYLAKVEVSKREISYEEIFGLKEKKLKTFNQLAED